MAARPSWVFIDGWRCVFLALVGQRANALTLARLARQISDIMVIFTYVVYLVFVYPAREPVIDEETCQYDEDGVLLRDTCKLLAPVRLPRRGLERAPDLLSDLPPWGQFRPWFPFGAVTFALLAVFGNMTNLLSILTIRITIALKGVKSPALLPVAKASTYTLYLGVWISFQSTISGITRMPATIGRLQADIGLDPITTIFSIVSLINTILLTPQQLSQITQSYGILYKGLLPIVSVNQVPNAPASAPANAPPRQNA